MKPIIETPRFYMRRITINDVQDFFELDSNPEVHKYLGNRPVKSIEESKAMVQSILDQYEQHNIGRFAVIDKETEEFLGWSGLKYETQLRNEYNYYDIGYRFKEQYWGKGVATETALATLNYGFNTLKLDTIEACASLDNVGSNKILRKIGLEFKGNYTINYKQYSGTVNWYKSTREDWLNKKTKG